MLREIFWDMNAISYRLETVSGGEDAGDTVILHITVTVKDHLQMADEYRFNADQRKLLEELIQPKYQDLFMALTGSYQDIELSPDEVAKIMENLPADLSEARREVVLTAYQLLGRVHYYWGGKSLVIGWDSAGECRWRSQPRAAPPPALCGPSDWIVREWWIGYSTTRAADNTSLGMAV
ncbi:hypothetical protein LEA_00717, partial [human gut metagenome]